MKKVLLVICSIICIVIVCKFGFEENNPYETKCIQPECNNERVEGSIYCKDHKIPDTETVTVETTTETTTKYSYDTKSSSYNNSSSNYSGSSKSYSNSSSSYGGSSSYSNSSSSYSGSSSYSSSPSSYSSSSSSSPYKSYDEGYEAVYDDDDYDWDRYNSDLDYADGVDDALDELDD